MTVIITASIASLIGYLLGKAKGNWDNMIYMAQMHLDFFKKENDEALRLRYVEHTKDYKQ